MENLRVLWSGLGAARRLALIGATLAVFVAVLGIGRLGGGRDMALLYAGLAPAAAGGVITALDQRGAAYEVRGDSIWVAAAQRDELRLSLAGAGLPEPAAAGYELLDGISGFGTTAQMFDVAYWRAKEGELARTILSVPGMRSARVHISPPTTRAFARESGATAAVTVTMAGGALDPDQARALRHLVAAAVSGLSPDEVAVIDSQRGLIPAGEGPAGANTAEELRLRATRLLEARVGAGNAVVEVAVETVTETESIQERRIDPESRVAIATETEERSASSQNRAPGAVTVASNLPDGDAQAQGGGGQSNDVESRSRSNFELSETHREVLRTPGAIRRLTVAVLVNDLATTTPDGTVASAPRPQAELDDLRALVESAVGLDAARGDQVTIRAMRFEPPPLVGTEAATAAQPLDAMALIQLAALVAVILLLALFVLRPVLLSARRPPLLAAPPEPAALAPPAPPRDLAAFEAEPAEIVDPVARLRRLIDSRQDETVRILQNWIEEPDRRRGANDGVA